MHQVENTGRMDFSFDAADAATSQIQAALEAARQRVAFEFRCGAPVTPFETHRLASGALYVRFDAFERPVLKQVEAALRTAGGRGVVLDLRANQGGLALPVLNLLLGRRTPVFYERGSSGRRLISTDAWSRRYRGPVVVLIGPASASAAEITAAALKYSHRAVIIGRRSNGSVLGAPTFPLPDGGRVRIPVADIEMLDGQRLEGTGVAPDNEIFPTLAELGLGKDPTLDRAERELQTRAAKD